MPGQTERFVFQGQLLNQITSNNLQLNDFPRIFHQQNKSQQ